MMATLATTTPHLEDVLARFTQRLGLSIEPAYDVFLAGGAANSFGVTAGPMFGW